MTQYGTIITNVGLAQIANAQVTQQKVGLQYIALGDGNGSYYVPTANQSALVNEVWRGPVSNVIIDPANDNRIIIEGLIPPTVGGFTIREIAVFDDQNQLIAVGQYPEKYKPQLSEGVSEETLIHFVIETNNVDAVELAIDPTIIIASREYVDEKVAAVSSDLMRMEEEFVAHLDNETVHLKEGERDKIANSWQKGVYNDVSVTNLGTRIATRLMTFNDWDVNNSKLDATYINIPTNNFSGIIKLTLFSGYNVTNAMGGAEVLYHIGKVNETTYANEKKIISMSSHFTARFYVGDAVYLANRLYIPITKAPNSRNLLCVKIELIAADDGQAYNLINNITMSRDPLIAEPHPWTPQTSSFVQKTGENTITGLLTTKEDVVIEGNVRSLVFRTPNKTHQASLRLNASDENDFGLDIWRNGTVGLRIDRFGKTFVQDREGSLFNLADLPFFLRWGYPNPEGTVTAVPGTLYLEATNGRLYVKQSGYGNTGWVMK
ncbi:phage tail protein [Lysinibacillus louembei]|uniref:Phage tail protein n=1 Tax=Lysinibacillus louembei TaxID=1470088 RepID=A0ABZ0RTS8_9BACI|nr:phage tail protein [Lysinibacillus louembei]WPK10601.1 phage tail protein [Lysinibacillus louembei]